MNALMNFGHKGIPMTPSYQAVTRSLDCQHPESLRRRSQRRLSVCGKTSGTGAATASDRVPALNCNLPTEPLYPARTAH
jgi:hypothetical protein